MPELTDHQVSYRGDFNGDGFDDLAIGVPGEGLGSKYNAGAVDIIDGFETSLAAPAKSGIRIGSLCVTSPIVVMRSVLH